MKILIRTLIALVILLLGLLLAGNYLLNKYADPLFAKAEKKLQEKGVKIEDFEYGKIRIVGLRTVRVHDCKVNVSLDESFYSMNKVFKASFNAKSVTIKIQSLKKQSITFSLDQFDLLVETDEKKGDGPYGMFDDARFVTFTPVYLTRPVESGREVLDKIKSFFKEQQTTEKFEFESKITLRLDNKEATVQLYSVRENGITMLQFDDDDIFAAAQIFEVDLVEKEAEIIARYPMKVPRMLQITRDAKRKSQTAYASDKTVPEDAFRHLYWSYHLTKEFGEDFANQITDAHETAPGNTKAERAMDYHNNEIGRKLASKTLSDEEILSLARYSKEVIRTPR